MRRRREGEVATDATGIPLGIANGAAGVPAAVVAGAALADTPAGVGVPVGAPVVADRGYDSDPLRGELAARGYVPVAPHRRGRPAANDGRRRRLVERTFARRRSDRRAATRYERRVDPHGGFVHLACALSARSRLVK